MVLDYRKMNGYEFEKFVATLFRKIGFIVEEVSLSGDGGIDLIAYSKEPVFKGKYLIQCKHWQANIGEPVVRDLYGVVLSNNANKGIIITNSYFTKQAIDFAEGKNIELINGDTLKGLIEQHWKDSLTNETDAAESRYFTACEGFDLDKYNHYKHFVDTDQKNFEAYTKYFNFLYNYVLDNNLMIMYSGLIDECLNVCDEIIKRFGSKGGKGVEIKSDFILLKGFLYMLLGKSDKAIETIQALIKFRGYRSELCFYPGYYRAEDSESDFEFATQLEFIDKVINSATHDTNLLSILVLINDEYSSKWLCKVLMNLLNKKKELTIASYEEDVLDSFFECQIDIDAAIKNHTLATEQIKSTMNGNDLKLFLPKRISTKGNYYKSGYTLEYSLNRAVKLDDIVSYWTTENDFDRQKERNKFLISVIDDNYSE